MTHCSFIYIRHLMKLFDSWPRDSFSIKSETNSVRPFKARQDFLIVGMNLDLDSLTRLPHPRKDT